MTAVLFNDRIIQSALDLDVYKINMMFGAFKLYPRTQVRYELIVRSNECLAALAEQVEAEITQLEECRFSDHDIHYLNQQADYLDADFLNYLAEFRFKPSEQVTVTTTESGQLRVSIQGLWHQTILYETMVMSIISEVRSRRFWADISYSHFADVLERKITHLTSQLAQRGIGHFQFSEMGSRRRFSAQVQREVVNYLRHNVPDLLSGTSNDHLAREFNLTPIGTVAHEWFMAHQQLVNIRDSQKAALDHWQTLFDGKLGIALTDTIGIEAFLKDFTFERAAAYAGVRHDSGCPFTWGDKIIAHYQSLGIDPTSKVLIFTDGLNFDRALDIAEYFAGKAKVSFGIGTFLANDMGDWTVDGVTYQPLSMVVKMTRCSDGPVAKISDEPEKAMCEDEAFLTQLKQQFGLLPSFDIAS
ncbi:nicotinate phosphoribosyltransferase [Vibrio pacinii]|uniref:nicotinate phosphoribosyltransferase n=1 Tax=Vibrio pacinii TaxID=170674 RepID=UPI00056E031E|nr:nicotinate phosphoribosyltransferase [Vibrio pacinii]